MPICDEGLKNAKRMLPHPKDTALMSSHKPWGRSRHLPKGKINVTAAGALAEWIIRVCAVPMRSSQS